VPETPAAPRTAQRQRTRLRPIMGGPIGSQQRGTATQQQLARADDDIAELKE